MPRRLTPFVAHTCIHTGVMKILHAAASMALVVGSELHQRAAVPSDHFLLQSIANAIVRPHIHTHTYTHTHTHTYVHMYTHTQQMLHADKDTGHLHSQQFSLWVKGHCPHLLEGMQQWIGSLLLHTSSASGSREPSPTEVRGTEQLFVCLFVFVCLCFE